MSRLYIPLLCAFALALSQSVAAQSIKSNTVVSIPTGPDTVTFTVDKGEITTKNKITIKFIPVVDGSGDMIGYKYESVGVDSIKVGDTVPFFIHKLSYGIGYGGAKDDTGAKVFFGTFGTKLSGAFKPVTVESVKSKAGVVTITFVEDAILGDKTKVKHVKLALKNGWYTTVK